MRILVVSQYFWPETFIINDLVSVLADQGNELTVLTGKPNYPEGVIFRGYNQDGVQRDTYNGVDVVRAPLRPRGKKGGLNLFRNYFSFIVNGLAHFPREIMGKKFDVILVYAPSPITSAIPAIFLKYKMKSHLAVWVQDLWPESLSETGYVKNRLILKMVSLLVRGIYRAADTILISSESFRKNVTRFVQSEKVFYYPNSMLDHPSGKDELSSKVSHGQILPPPLVSLFKNNFCLVFAGNIGAAQAMETLVSAAQFVRDLKSLKIVLVGSGSMLEWVKERKSVLNLDNIEIAGRFPMSLMPAIFSEAKGLLVLLKDSPAFSCTLPSKVQAYLAAGHPIIASMNGEGARVIAESGAGLHCPAEDAKLLGLRMRELFFMSEEQRRALGRAGKAYFIKHFEMNMQASKLVNLLSERTDFKG